MARGLFGPAFLSHHLRPSLAQRAFAHLHGPICMGPMRCNSCARRTGGPDQWVLGGLPLRQGRPLARDEGLTPDAFHANEHGWVKWGVLRPDHHLDPGRITKLNDKEMVWFDPVHGFSTDADNLKGDWLDRAFPYVFAAAITAMTFGAGSTVAAGISSAAGGGTAGSIAVGASTGAVSNAALQLAANGKINFGQLLQSALAGGATAGISHIPGVGQYLDGHAGSFGQRLMEYTGRATVQGAIQAVMGGKFRDGMVNSLIGSLAGEVTAQLDAQIREIKGLSPGEASALRLLARATGSALRVAGSGDPAAGFASDFLGGVMQEGLASHDPAAANAADLRPDENVTDPDWSSGNGPADVVIDRETDPNYLDVASISGAPLARLAARGLALLTTEMASHGYKLIAPEVYFQPDAPGARPIRIDGVFHRDGRIVFGEAKIGDYSDFTTNQRNGISALANGRGTFYGNNAAGLASQMGIKPDSSGRFTIPAEKIQGVYAATYERQRSPTSRMQMLNDALRRNGGFGRGSDI